MQDVREVIALALGGCVLFSGFAIGNLYVRKKVGTPDFVHATKALKFDPTLCGMLAEVEIEIKTKDSIGFLRLVNAVDRIVDTRAKLSQQSIHDAPVNKNHLQQMALNDQILIRKQYIPRLIDIYKQKTDNPQDCVDFEDLLKGIQDQIQSFIEHIWTLTT
jgi:hypothetical protein